MMGGGIVDNLATRIADLTGAITDKQSPNYDAISPAWRVSNSEGYALWFESRMKQAGGLLQERAFKAQLPSVDELPVFRWRSPLQTCVQILKRHRDVMFATNSDGAPISIIITTLAGHAYRGEARVASALDQILLAMDQYIRPRAPRVPNPVNPAEDFADKWQDPKCLHLDLEGNFGRWLTQARIDFRSMIDAKQTDSILEHAKRTFAANLDRESLNSRLGFGGGGLLAPAVTPSGLTFPPKPIVPSKPAGFA